MSKSRKDKFAALYEHVCNCDTDKASELFHEIVVEMARDIHNEMMSCEEGVHDDELEGDMEHDLADDLEAVDGGHEEGNLEAHAEEDLTNDLLGDEDMKVDGEEEPEGEFEVEPEGEKEQETEVAADVEEIKDHMLDIDEELEKLQAMFDEMSGEEPKEETKESMEMSKVAVKMGGEQGGGHYAGTEVNVKSPTNDADGVKLGGEPVEIGKGPKHTGFERQEPTVKAKELGKFVNVVKSGNDVLKKVAGRKGTEKAEVGSGKSGMPIEANPESPISGKRKI
jgi:hypothetical protein